MCVERLALNENMENFICFCFANAKYFSTTFLKSIWPRQNPNTPAARAAFVIQAAAVPRGPIIGYN